ncbi:Fc.00g012310.m01.CDS01 [Cosmosporella sp. VM-42]
MTEFNERTYLLPREGLPPSTPRLSIICEVVGLAKATAPISASFALQNIVQALSIVTAGSLGPDQLDIASYGFMFATCTGSMVAIGGATALDTLCGQAVASSKAQNSPTILGGHLQQSLFILKRDFALGTGRFLVFMIPGGYFQVVAECLKKYAQVRGQSNAVGWIVCVAAAIGIVANIVLIKATEFGASGAPAAFLVHQLVTVGFLVVLLSRRERQKQTIKLIRGWAELVDGLGTNLFLGLTGLLTIATEWWSFEILAMMAAKLQPTEVSAQSILMSADLIFTTISLGIGVAASHRIGQLLGSNEAQLARKATMSPYILSVALGIIEFLLIYSFRSRFDYLFTGDASVVAKTAEVLPFMATFLILDLSNGGAGGILRGARKNHLCGLCNFIAYYGVGLSMSWVLCFRLGWGLVGLWAGIISGSGALLVLQTFCVAMLPWKKASLEASGEED